MNSLKLNAASTPGTVTIGTATTGGTLAAATYYYKITYKINYGPLPTVLETTTSAEVNQVTTGATSTVTLTLPATPPNVASINVYRSTATGAEVFLTNIAASATSFVDTGALTPGTATPPATGNNPGNIFVPGSSVGAQYQPGYPPALTVAAVPTPFVSGRLVTVSNPTAGAIVLNGSADNVTYASLGTVPALGYLDVVLPNFTYAASAGLYALGSP